MWRMWAVFSFILFLFSIIVFRLVSLQILENAKFRLQAIDQHYLQLLLPATRGNIITSDGYTLVMNQPAYLVYAKPKEITDISSFTRKISEFLSVNPTILSQQLSDKTKYWIPIAHKIETGLVDKLKETFPKELGFEKESKRFYPEASMAAHLLGFVGYDDNGIDKGYFGIEGYYNRELRGKDGSIRIEKDIHGDPILVGEEERIPSEDGRSLILWLDRTVQRICEEKLKEGIEKYGAKEGSVVVMDPKTGGILAMASYPSYDPLLYSSYDHQSFKNPIVAESYEPGSTFKVLIMGAAINEKLVTPQTIIPESGPVQIAEYVIRTWNNQYRGSISMTDVLVHSSNVGMVYVARKLGIKRLLDYIHSLGLGKPTGVDLEEESSPDLRPDKEWSEIDLATASFGQGIALTPLQMIRAVGAIANDGWLVEPKIVKEIRDTKGHSTELKPLKSKQVFSRSTAQILTEIMVTTVENGEAKWTRLKGYRIAGKTGTAQIPIAGHYDDKKTIASFIGFAPADDPKFVMLVTLREPSSSPWGSETAAPSFFAIARELFTYYGFAPQ